MLSLESVVLTLTLQLVLSVLLLMICGGVLIVISWKTLFSEDAARKIPFIGLAFKRFELTDGMSMRAGCPQKDAWREVQAHSCLNLGASAMRIVESWEGIFFQFMRNNLLKIYLLNGNLVCQLISIGSGCL
ncbi:hypothetical protein AVEN_148071-1 [Araneus ventricosus]|uniref:Uncharacterized protein n=1 Tax=Araneus ventricosus TaxID=182803 RepID=A0A4Y2TH07_ARAVE|nr:hypothetical protein AVEN_148071-1 [Araneus ventricosus]